MRTLADFATFCGMLPVLLLSAASCTFVPEASWRQSRILQHRGAEALAAGRVEEAEARLSEALALRAAYFGADDDIAARLRDGIGTARLARGEPAAAEQEFRRAHAVFAAFDCVSAERARVVLHLCQALLLQGERAAASEIAAAERELARDRLPSQDEAHAWLEIAGALTRAAAEDLEAARDGVRAASERLAASGSPGDAAWGFYVAGLLAQAAGDRPAAAEDLDRAARLSRAHRGPVHPLTLAGQVAAARAWTAAPPPAPEPGRRGRSKWEEFLALFEPGRDADWRLRNLENLLDDPVDDLKHRLHGMRFGDQRVFLPRALMPGSGNPCK